MPYWQGGWSAYSNDDEDEGEVLASIRGIEDVESINLM